MPGSQSSVRTITVRGGLAGLVSLTLAVGGLTLTAPTAHAADSQSRVDLPRIASTPQVVAASGASLIVNLMPNGEPLYRVTNDQGRTWADLSAPNFAKSAVGYAGGGAVVYYESFQGTDADTSDVYRYDFASGTTTGPTTLPAEQPDAIASTAAVYHSVAAGQLTYSARSLASGTTNRLAYTPVAGTDTVITAGSGPVALFATGVGETGSGSLSLVPLDGGAVAATAAVPGLRAVAVRGEQAIYVTSTSSSTRLCVRDAGAWTGPRCWGFPGLSRKTLAKATFGVSVGSEWALVTVDAANGSSLGEFVANGNAGGPLAAVRARAGAQVFGAGDSPRPLAAVGTGGTGYVGQVRADGAIERLFANPTAPVTVTSLLLTPTRLLALDNRPDSTADGFQASERKVAASGIGDEALLQGRVQNLGASAGRTLAEVDGRLRVGDRDATGYLPLPKYGSDPSTLSGPYFLSATVAYTQVSRVDGAALRKGSIRALFGSLALRLNNSTRNRFEVLDTVTGSTQRVTVPAELSPRTFSCLGLWGDWVIGVKTAGDSDDVTTAVINYRTSQTWTHLGYPIAWGDGFAVLDVPGSGDAPDDYLVWRFESDTTEKLPDTVVRAPATDGTSRLAYTTGSELVLRTLDGVGASAPRVLGIVAPATINLAAGRLLRVELDATKALSRGTAEIRDAAGGLVRSLSFGAAPDGSVRDLVWDGRDAAGTPVPLGDYSWSLAATAADGTGSLVKVDGSAGVGGGVRVVGSLTTAKPKLSDRTPKVGQRLSARPGVWGPAGVAFSYRWYRVSAKGKFKAVGSAQRYRVKARDKGLRLVVEVTGKLAYYDDSVLSSARSAKVKRR
ncbi:MAG TPA: FlgD immunoglobulin-like domain containing protein [Propionicimonas sp.]|nr:FlgD immunoglobulin-like domain containing protein [Propionicimonas sp.]